MNPARRTALQDGGGCAQNKQHDPHGYEVVQCQKVPSRGDRQGLTHSSPLLAKTCPLALGCISLEERLLFVQRCLVLPTSYAHGAVSAQRRPFPSDKDTRGQPGMSVPWDGEERASIAASLPSGSDGDCSISGLLLAPLSSSLL